MTEFQVYTLFLRLSFGLALAIFIALFFIDAPYGRHTRRGWGPTLPNRLGWLLMEAPAALGMLVLFWIGDAPKSTPTLVFLLLWEAHYLHRAFIYPFAIADGHKPMPLVVMLMAVAFNLGNVYINGRYLFHFSSGYPAGWLHEPRFMAGVLMFIAGYGINRWSDMALRNLRQPGESGYRIPRGGIFQWVSCPNYLGEILEWSGWALATWSLPGLAFAVWTAANLAPRARSHHRWYRQRFPDYPPERKALLPGLW